MCPNSAIELKERDGQIKAEIVTELCDECTQCMEFCLRGAIKQA
jgi:NAD-dependent dihydropyrimidine dehydrogenase PreA subunit